MHCNHITIARDEAVSALEKNAFWVILGKGRIIIREIHVGLCVGRKVGELPAFLCLSKQPREPNRTQEIGNHSTAVALELSAR